MLQACRADQQKTVHINMKIMSLNVKWEINIGATPSLIWLALEVTAFPLKENQRKHNRNTWKDCPAHFHNQWNINGISKKTLKYCPIQFQHQCKRKEKCNIVNIYQTYRKSIVFWLYVFLCWLSALIGITSRLPQDYRFVFLQDCLRILSEVVAVGFPYDFHTPTPLW